MRSDGFGAVDEAGGGSMIRGEKLKFTNAAEWVNADGEVIPADCEFLIVEVRKALQKWSDDRPVETRVLADDELFPDVNRMNAEEPPESWREAFGKKVGPWQRTVFIYMIDPKTMRGYTYPTSTFGGFRAVSDLKADVKRARLLHGTDNIFPLVTLGSTPMKTQYGGRDRPAFEVVRFVPIGGNATPLLADPKAPPMNDSIPY
jgi:hypothetical protein